MLLNGLFVSHSLMLIASCQKKLFDNEFKDQLFSLSSAQDVLEEAAKK